MNSHRLLSCSYVLLLASIFALATGCGSVSSGSNPTPTPTATPTPGTTPSPTPVPTPSPSPTATPSPTPNPASAITGRVVDPSGAPVVGTVVVDLERGGGDFFTFIQTAADDQGRFRFNNVPPLPAQSTGYALMVAARAAHDPGTAPGARPAVSTRRLYWFPAAAHLFQAIRFFQAQMWGRFSYASPHRATLREARLPRTPHKKCLFRSM
jgi:hypothetical protein